MSPTSSPAPLELQPVPPDQPSPTTPTPTSVHVGDVICDPASTDEQQPRPNDDAIQDSVPTTTETEVAGECLDGLDNSTGERQQVVYVDVKRTDVGHLL